ncbi:MAG: SDR family oxidoreductase [Chloroflexi bacterium]|nr:SDR family oxidoreductase [Chloroflexota bacterium]
MDLGIRDKVAIVAASSKGIGLATARSLAAEGVKLSMCARDRATLEQAVADVRSSTGAEVIAVPTDVSQPEQVEALVKATVDHFGTVHILVNNAGGPALGPFTSKSDDDWLAAFELNFLSTVRLARACLPYMHWQRWGRIISLMSTSVKQPIDGLLLSNAVRAGVAGLSKTLANEVATEGITVNLVLPGRIETDRLRSSTRTRANAEGKPFEELYEAGTREVPMKRYGRPEEVGDVITFLASERASYVTGTAIQVDGGLVRSTV